MYPDGQRPLFGRFFAAARISRAIGVLKTTGNFT
jgi:hypothetical protein